MGINNNIEYTPQGWHRAMIKLDRFQTSQILAVGAAIITGAIIGVLALCVHQASYLHHGLTSSFGKIAFPIAAGSCAMAIAITGIALHFFANYTDKLKRSHLDVLTQAHERHTAKMERVHAESTKLDGKDGKNTKLKILVADKEQRIKLLEKKHITLDTRIRYLQSEAQQEKMVTYFSSAFFSPSNITDVVSGREGWKHFQSNYRVALGCAVIALAMLATGIGFLNPAHLSTTLNVTTVVAGTTVLVSALFVAAMIGYGKQAPDKYAKAHLHRLFEACREIDGSLSNQDAQSLRERYLQVMSDKEWKQLLYYIDQRDLPENQKRRVLNTLSTVEPTLFWDKYIEVREALILSDAFCSLVESNFQPTTITPPPTIAQVVERREGWENFKANYMVILGCSLVGLASLGIAIGLINPGHLSKTLNVITVATGTTALISAVFIGAMILYKKQAPEKRAEAQLRHLFDACQEINGKISNDDAYHLSERYLKMMSDKEWNQLFYYLDRRAAPEAQKLLVLKTLHTAQPALFWNMYQQVRRRSILRDTFCIFATPSALLSIQTSNHNSSRIAFA